MNKGLALVCLLLLPWGAWGQRKAFDRGYPTAAGADAVVAPKGSWMLGGNLGFSSSSQQDFDFLLVGGINANAHNLIASPAFCYMVADNIGIGVRGKYTRGYLALESAEAGDGATTFRVSNYSYLRHKYLGAVFFRYYRPFGPSGRVSAYVDGEIALGGSQLKVQDAHSENIRGSFDTAFHVTVGANAGLMAFLTSHLAVDMRVGLLEFGYGVSDQIHNQVNKGRATFGAANFMVDPLSLSVGLSYYL
ncbi:MAG: hypothetical protein J5871_05205 [Bacteroidales bacterium]|nr:hypothetical protein [Bacteroidales bacterium]